MTATIGGPHQRVEASALEAFLAPLLAAEPLDGRRVALVIPDATRSCPLPLVLEVVHRLLVPRVAELTCVIALGTHAPMGDADINRMLGAPEGVASRYPAMTVVNHEWWRPEMLVEVGHITADRIAELSEGRLRQGATIRVNRHVAEADVALVIGPVFPHEVVGFSGGNKYFIPGVADHEFIDMTHWVGALISSAQIIGTTGITPVRAMIDEGAALIPTTRRALCLVVESGSGALEAAAYGRCEDAWAAAAAVAAETHVEWVDAPFTRVISVMPERYQDIWTAAKGFYKLEPAMADGGEVVIYAPHITEISQTHPEILDIGYHCRDWFVKQWDTFRDVPWGVLAHSTHLRGAGTYDASSGVESCRLKVTLATGIPREVCESVNLGHLDPASIDLEHPGEGTTVIPNAGEILFRLAAERDQ